MKAGEGGFWKVVLRRAQLQPLKSVAKKDDAVFQKQNATINLWNAKEARLTATNKTRFHNARESKEVLEVDGGRLLGGVAPRCRPAS
jgi:hypothetical protein